MNSYDIYCESGLNSGLRYDLKSGLVSMFALFAVTIMLMADVGVVVDSNLSDKTRSAEFNLSKGQFALKGYDPVSYFLGDPVKGRHHFIYTHHKVSYRFSSQDNLDQFKASPQKYEPQFGGWCAWAMYDGGRRAKIHPESYLIVNGKLYVFYDTFIADTKKLWTERSQTLDQRKMIKIAEAFWGALILR